LPVSRKARPTPADAEDFNEVVTKVEGLTLSIPYPDTIKTGLFLAAPASHNVLFLLLKVRLSGRRGSGVNHQPAL
jgi:hypothetical protein